MQQDEDDLEQDDSNSESDEYHVKNADSDSDSDASDDVDPGTGSQGETFVRIYILEQARTSMIDSHRRAMGVLLVEDAGVTHNFRRLTRRALKERQLLSSIFCYFRYLRGIRSTLDVRKFHLFPEYSMVVKHFHTDERILEQMCNLESDQPKPWTLRRLRLPPMPNAGPNTSIWDQIFDLEHLRRNCTAEHIGMTSDGVGCCVTFGPQPQRRRGEGQAEVERRTRQDGELLDLNLNSFRKGMFKLDKVEHQSIQTALEGSTLIGVDPGMKSLITAVRL